VTVAGSATKTLRHRGQGSREKQRKTEEQKKKARRKERHRESAKHWRDSPLVVGGTGRIACATKRPLG